MIARSTFLERKVSMGAGRLHFELGVGVREGFGVSYALTRRWFVLNTLAPCIHEYDPLNDRTASKDFTLHFSEGLHLRPTTLIDRSSLKDKASAEIICNAFWI